MKTTPDEDLKMGNCPYCGQILKIGHDAGYFIYCDNDECPVQFDSKMFDSKEDAERASNIFTEAIHAK